jgi:hypothetical protein
MNFKTRPSIRLPEFRPLLVRLVILACHLAGGGRSSSNPKLWQHNILQQNPAGQYGQEK